MSDVWSSVADVILVPIAVCLGSCFRPQLCGNATQQRRPPIWQRPDLIEPPDRPLPPARSRLLTNAAGARAQLQCPLVARLPAEIRTLIWAHVLGRENDDDVLHLEPADGILRHNRCYESGSPAFQHDCWSAAWRMSFRTGGALGKKEPKSHHRAIIPLLLTCRLIYSESVDLLYSANTFDFRRTRSLVRLPKIMLPHRLQQLRRLQFSTAFACYIPNDTPATPADFWSYPDDRVFWPTACDILASLQHLQYARIFIMMTCQPDRHHHPADPELLCDILRPLKAVRASEYVVEITQLVEEMRERLGPTPFLLVEREPPVR